MHPCERKKMMVCEEGNEELGLLDRVNKASCCAVKPTMWCSWPKLYHKEHISIMWKKKSISAGNKGLPTKLTQETCLKIGLQLALWDIQFCLHSLECVKTHYPKCPFCVRLHLLHFDPCRAQALSCYMHRWTPNSKKTVSGFHIVIIHLEQLQSSSIPDRCMLDKRQINHEGI